MATLDRIMELQQKGIADTEISSQLQKEGISPKEINDSFNQARIKAAVTSPGQEASPLPGQEQMPAQQPMQQSIMQAPPEAPTQQPPSTPMPGQEQMPAQQPMQQYPPEGEQPIPTEQETYYPQTPQAYPEQGYYPQQGVTDTDTISEISEQIFSEKFDEFKKKVGDIPLLKTELRDKISDIDYRLKRIENTIDKLQQAIIQKVGDFGENTTLIRNDLENLHDTTSKLMNPLIDNYNELKKLSEKK